MGGSRQTAQNEYVDYNQIVNELLKITPHSATELSAHKPVGNVRIECYIVL